jgi:hypothetical protein
MLARLSCNPLEATSVLVKNRSDDLPSIAGFVTLGQVYNSYPWII